MRHVNYARWAMYVIDLFEWAAARRVHSVLELACGTGKMLVELAQAGFETYGLDSSFEMVKTAAARLARASEQAASMQAAHADEALLHASSWPCTLATCRVWCGDMQNFAIATPVDAVICLYDSFNYCLEPEGARRILDGVAQAVRQDGLFIFDVCTERNCRRNFHNYYEREGFGMYSYIRRSHFKAYRKIQVNEFFITDEIAGGPTLYERHAQRIYSLREINAMIDPAQWKVVGCFDGMSRRPGTEKSDRVHFALKRI